MYEDGLTPKSYTKRNIFEHSGEECLGFEEISEISNTLP